MNDTLLQNIFEIVTDIKTTVVAKLDENIAETARISVKLDENIAETARISAKLDENIAETTRVSAKLDETIAEVARVSASLNNLYDIVTVMENDHGLKLQTLLSDIYEMNKEDHQSFDKRISRIEHFHSTYYLCEDNE